MQHALKGVPVAEVQAPPGVVNMGGDWYYEENARNGGVSSLGMEGASDLNAGGSAGPGPPNRRPQRSSRILDLFRKLSSQSKSLPLVEAGFFMPEP
jgi:penicillin-binding protein 1A